MTLFFYCVPLQRQVWDSCFRMRRKHVLSYAQGSSKSGCTSSGVMPKYGEEPTQDFLTYPRHVQ